MSEPVNLATAVEFHNEIARLHGEIARLRLTDAEREAVRYMIAAGKFGQRDEALTEEHAATLRGLLERTK